jgi:uncharacterized protein
MTSAADLFGLQEIDIARDNRRSLVAAREEAETAQAEVETIRREQRDLETQVQDLDARIGPMDAKLYSGEIRNPKELSSLQHEIDYLKEQRGTLDEAGLAVLERMDTATGRLDSARQRTSLLDTEWKADVVDLQAQRARVETELGRLEDERGRRVAGMEGSALGAYEALRPKKNGRAVAKVERGTCQGCRLLLPSHVVQKTRAGTSIVTCPSCERILVNV